MGNVKQTAKAYKPKTKLSSVVAKQNAKPQVMQRVADASKIADAIAKTTASNVMQPAETLGGEEKYGGQSGVNIFGERGAFFEGERSVSTSQG